MIYMKKFLESDQMRAVQFLVLKHSAKPRYTTVQVKFFLWWPFDDQLFKLSRQRTFLAAKIYINN